jgi:hypothetical protein
VIGGPAGRWIAATIGFAVLLLGTLPVAGWIPGGLTDPAYSRRMQEWALGTLICVGAGIVAALVVSESIQRRIAGGWRSLGARLPVSSRAVDLTVATICLVAFAVASQSVLGGKPLLIDELVQVLQARLYADGHLSTPVDSARAFFSVLHVVDTGDRVYSQFPPGWPAMLALPSLVNAEWLVGPVCGAVAVLAFSRIARRIFSEASPLFVPMGALLFGLSPFSLFQFASHMSHGPLVMWLLVAILAAARMVEEGAHAPARWAAFSGFALGAAFAVRPLDAAAFGLPLLIWLMWNAAPGQRLRSCAVFAAGGLAPVASVAWVNASTTGNPFTFGYEALWGPTHGLGFHAAPWGDAHTIARGVELLSAYATRLNVYLLESPFPALLPAILALLIVTRLSRIEWLLLSSSTVHALLYFAYWHDGFYLGPRFVLPWVPLAVLLTLRAVRLAAVSSAPSRVRMAFAGAGVAAVVLSVGIAIPVRVSQYRSGLTSMRVDYAKEAEAAGVSNALVFVQESWGARLVARLWALGVSRTATASLYAGVDACVLEHAITALEQGGVAGAVAEDSLRPLLVNASKVRASDVSPDTTERMLPGSVYDAKCSAQVLEDREGYALYPPFLLDRTSGNTYVRDLLAADSVLIDRTPGRPLYRVRRDGVDGGSRLVWSKITRASVVSSNQKP